jgi:glycosyltransferase involved in cell wall biosynthesis
MLSAVIATHESERQLVPTLATLVAGATAGLLREVIVADAGSRDDTAAVADIAGCRFIVLPGTAGARLAAAAKTARAPWLMFIRPGTVLGSSWVDAAAGFLSMTWPSGQDRAAVFRSQEDRTSAMKGLAATLRAALGRARTAHAVILSKRTYDLVGGHRDCTDSESDLLRRIGRRRIVTLPVAATMLSA